jgi:hypothetical protein
MNTPYEHLLVALSGCFFIFNQDKQPDVGVKNDFNVNSANTFDHFQRKARDFSGTVNGFISLQYIRIGITQGCI